MTSNDCTQSITKGSVEGNMQRPSSDMGQNLNWIPHDDDDDKEVDY